MEFRQLEIFRAVVESGSFSRAGEELFLSQPTITIHIKALESEIGQQLLERSTQGVKLTPVGQQVYQYALTALQERANLMEQLGCTHPEHAVVRIAASSIPAHYLLPQLIAAFRKRHKGVSFHMLHGNSADVGRYLLERKADLGLCGTPTVLEECDYQPVTNDRLIVITPSSSRYDSLPREQPFPVELLLSEPIIARESGSGTRREFEAWLQKKTGQRELNIAAVMSDNQAIKNAVVAGIGIAVLSERSVADYLKKGYLLGFRLDGIPERKLCLVSRKKTKLQGMAGKFREFVLNTVPVLLEEQGE